MENPNKINEDIIASKKDTLAQVSELKKVAQSQVSQKVQTSVDPVASRQQDLDTLSLEDFRYKYGTNSDVTSEYVSNQFKGVREDHATQERQRTADSLSAGDFVADSALGILATSTDLAGGTAGLAVQVEADPVEALTEGAIGLGEIAADFIGKKDVYNRGISKYRDAFSSIGDSVDNFLEDVGFDISDETEDGAYESTAKAIAGGIFEGTDAASKYIREFQSDALHAKSAIRQEKNQEYRAKLQEELGEDAGALETAWKNIKIGGEAMYNLLQDPAALGIETISQLPSLAVAGKSSQIFSTAAHKKAVKEITDSITSQRLPHSNMKELVTVELIKNGKKLQAIRTKAGENAAILTSGILEGSGAASEAYNAIIATPTDQLNKVSARYQVLVQEMSPEEARKQLAVEGSYGAGMSILALASVVTKVSGAGAAINRASGVVKTPQGFIPKSASIAGDAAKEGIEEFTQSYLGGVATGNVKQANIDESIDVHGEAATQAGEGALTGIGTSVGMSALRATVDSTAKGAKKVGDSIEYKSAVKKQVKDIKENGLTEANIDPTSQEFDFDATIQGIEERNQVEDVTPKELSSNYYEAYNLIGKGEEYLISLLEFEEKNGSNKELQTKINEAFTSIEKAKESVAKMEARLTALQGEATPEDSAKAIEGDKAASERVLRNMASAPESVNPEVSKALINSGSLDENQTAIAEAHIQYVQDTKSIDEVHSDVMRGGKGFLGIKQYMGTITSALKAGKPEAAQSALESLTRFADRQTKKSQDFSEGLAIAKTPNPTPEQRARLNEINALYPNTSRNANGRPTIGRESDTLVNKVGVEANALNSAVQLATLNIEGETNATQTTTEVEEVPETTETESTTTETPVSEESEQTTEVDYTKLSDEELHEIIDNDPATNEDDISKEAGDAYQELSSREEIATKETPVKAETEVTEETSVSEESVQTTEGSTLPKVTSILKDNELTISVSGNVVGAAGISKVNADGTFSVIQPSVEEGKGYGQALYLEAAKIYPEASIESSDISPSAEAMWERLVAKGFATKQEIDSYPGVIFTMYPYNVLVEKGLVSSAKVEVVDTVESLGELIKANKARFFTEGITDEVKAEADELNARYDAVIYKAIQDGGKSRLGKAALNEALKAGLYSDTEYQYIAQVIRDSLGNNKVQVVAPDSPLLYSIDQDRYADGIHHHDGNVYLSSSMTKGRYAEILLHELIHAVLVPELRDNPNSNFAIELNKLYEFMVEQGKKDGNTSDSDIAYGLSNPDEFLAMAMSNPTFVQWMKDTKIADKSIFTRFAQIVSDFLGLGKDYYSAFENLLDISSEVLNTSGISTPTPQTESTTTTTTTEPVVEDAIVEEEVEPVVTEDINLSEQLVGTTETLTDVDDTVVEAAATPEARRKEFTQEQIVHKNFRPRNKTGVTENPILSVKNFMSVLVSNANQMIKRFTNIEEVTGKQRQLIAKLADHHGSFSESLDAVFKFADAKNRKSRDLTSYLFEDGVIPENVKAAMSAITYNWVATRAGETLFNTDEDIRDILELGLSDPITSEMRRLVGTGGFRGHVAATLGKDILKAIGIEAKPTAAGNLQPQLENALGLLALTALSHQGLITNSKFKSNLVFEDADKDEVINKITAATVPGEQYAELDPLLQDYADSVKDTDQLLSKLFNVEAFSKGPLKEPNKKVTDVVRGTLQKVGKKYKDIIRKHQARRHYLKREQVEQFLSLSIEAQREMLGYTFDMSKVHAQRKDAVEGANRAINAGINHMMDYLAENNNDEPFYFNHDVIKNGRLLLDSNTFNPQNNKLHRHMMFIQGQESTIDFRSEDPTQLNQFLIAVGQGMGVDVDKQLNSKTLEQVRDLIQKPWFVDAIQAINSKDGDFTQEQERIILDAIKEGGEKSWSFDALVAYAAYTKAALDGSETFTHTLMLEADGITNGPAIGTIQFGIGDGKADKIVRLKKVGINTKGDVEEFGHYISQPNNRDNYETITLELEDKTSKFVGDDLLVSNFTKFLLGDLTIVDTGSGEVTKINRNISKNPLMTTIYGAGSASIKAAIGKATVDALYKYLEDNANDPQALAMLGKHLNRTFSLGVTPADLKDPLNATLEAHVEAGIAKQVGEVFGTAMLEAIDEQYGQFKESTVVVNEAMGRVAETFQLMFEHAVDKKTKEMVEDGILAQGRNGDVLETLPKAEVDKILADLIESQPIMQSVLSAQNNNATEEGLYVGKIGEVASTEEALHTTQIYNKSNKLNVTDISGKQPEVESYSFGSMYARVKEYISGGASPVVLAVQNIDATTMLEHLNDHASFNVYDAIITGVDDVVDFTKNINEKFYNINRDHSIAIEAQKAFQRAELAAQKYDRENDTNFREQFAKDSTRGYGKNKVEVNVKSELKETTELTEQARLDTVGLIASSGQYGWEGASHVVNPAPPAKLTEQALGNQPDATEGEFHTEAEIEVNKMSILEVFDNLTNMGNKLEDLDHRQFLRDSVNTLKAQLINPIKLHIGDVLKHKDAKGNDTLAHIQGDDIFMYTQMFGGQKGSTGILNSGLRMSSQEALAHELWHAVSRQGVEGNERAKKELETRWNQAKSVITPFDLMDDPSLGENSPEYMEAQRTWDYIFTPRVDKVDVVVNPVTGQTQPKTYSNHLHEFAAYSMTNAKFIKALQQVPVDTKVKTEVRQDDGSYLNSLYNKLLDFLGGIVDLLSTHLTNTKGLSQDLAVQELVKQISNIEAQNKNAILSTIDTFSKGAGKLSGVLSSTVNVITKPIQVAANAKFVKDSKSAFIRLPGRIIRLKDEKDSVAWVYDQIKKVTGSLDAEKQNFGEALLTEARGLTEHTKNFHTLSRMKTKMIDGAVVETEGHVYDILTKAFGDTVLSEQQQKAITKAFLKTDLSSLNLNQNQLIAALDDPTWVNNAIAKLEGNLANEQHVNHYLLQAKALGHYMATGRVTSANMNFNAKQIARLFGTGKNNPRAAVVEKAIDQLATLYALKDTDSSYKVSLSELVKSEQVKGTENGMTFLQAFHQQQKEYDLKEVFSGSEVNVSKGHIREEYDPNIQAVLLTEEQGALYEARGWTKGTELFKDPADPTAAPLYLYVNTHGGQTHTISGIISLTSKQARGTDTVKIRQTFGDSAPVYGGLQDTTRIHLVKSQQFNNSLNGASTFDANKASTHMAPLFDLQGNITGYRYLMQDKTKDNVLKRSQDALRLVAKGAASTVNKVNSKELNEKSIEALKVQFDEKPDAKYVLFGPSSTDPEIRELYALLPRDAKDHIQKVWGSNTMFVDKQVLTMMFGYRKFSVADALAKEKADQHLITQMFGFILDLIGSPFNLGAEQIARTAGKTWQEFISLSKDFIVIKTGIVTAANTVSNGLQLWTEGLGLIDILKNQKEAAVELTRYRNQRAELFELEKMVELGVQSQNLKQQKTRIAQLQAELTANPITDIVEDGLLQTIVEDVSLVDDQFTLAGKGKALLDKHVFTKVPGFVREVANEAFQSHESFLYKKMAQSAQLSDFVARYALYKHKVANGTSRQDAANDAISVFINYDLPTHRSIQYGNDMGFLWFTKYYIRIQKVLIKTLIKEPLRVLSLILGDWFSGDVLADMYDSTLSPDNVGNRVRLPDTPVEMIGNLALAQVL